MAESLKEVAWELGETSRMLRRQFNRHAAAVGATSAQWRAMFRLSREPGMKQVELADRLDVEPITAGRTVDRLEEAGLVERRRDPVDRRVWRLYLTDRADPMIERLKIVAEEVLAGALEGISKDEIAALRGILERIRENVSAIEDAERKSA
jgi:MarR family transcriptional regulator, transcriptional regulator for hemolysin